MLQFNSYPKALSSAKEDQSINIMDEEIESLNKFRHYLNLVDVCDNK